MTVQPPPLPKWAYAYVRVSTVDQQMSIDAQKHMIESYYEHNLKPLGYRFGGFFTDEGKSAWKIKFNARPAGGALNGRLRRGDFVIVGKFDRAFRSTLDALNTTNAWSLRGIEFSLLGTPIDCTTPHGRLMLTVLSAVAEFECAIRSARQIEANEERRRQGLAYNGVPPRGYRIKNKRLVPNEHEHDLMKSMLYLRSLDLIDWEIHRVFKTAGVVHPRTKRPFSPGAICAWIEKAKGHFGLQPDAHCLGIDWPPFLVDRRCMYWRRVKHFRKLFNVTT
jgi:putative DNA-invertase from lambdoid prophage Rac